jgi:hypothetical protein
LPLGAKRYGYGVTVTVHIPDDLMGRLRAQGGGDLSRRLMEALAIDEYRQGRMSKDLRQLLGFETRPALDAFLKERGVFEEYTLDDLEHERQDLRAAIS